MSKIASLLILAIYLYCLFIDCVFVDAITVDDISTIVAASADKINNISVKYRFRNTSYDASGKVLSDIQGKYTLMKGMKDNQRRVEYISNDKMLSGNVKPSQIIYLSSNSRVGTTVFSKTSNILRITGKSSDEIEPVFDLERTIRPTTCLISFYSETPLFSKDVVTVHEIEEKNDGMVDMFYSPNGDSSNVIFNTTFDLKKGAMPNHLTTSMNGQICIDTVIDWKELNEGEWIQNQVTHKQYDLHTQNNGSERKPYLEAEFYLEEGEANVQFPPDTFTLEGLGPTKGTIVVDDTIGGIEYPYGGDDTLKWGKVGSIGEQMNTPVIGNETIKKVTEVNKAEGNVEAQSVCEKEQIQWMYIFGIGFFLCAFVFVVVIAMLRQKGNRKDC